MADRAALVVDGCELTYRELRQRAARIAATIQRRAPEGGSPTTAVFADRSSTSFAGILGSLLAGRTYVPLSPNFPVAKTKQMLQSAGSRVLVVDARASVQLPDVLGDLEPTLIVLTDGDASAYAERWPRHTFVGADGLESEGAWEPVTQSPTALAYLLFTSGSTGVPKGVMVTHANAMHFVAWAADHFAITADDRFSQTFDTTFDLSVFDMFVAWSRGACVYCPPRAALWNPDRFIREHGLTVWFSVPSVAMMMNRLGALKPGQYPTLRWSLFCGERLLVETVQAWAAAAPDSVIENLYGPTELTVACTAYRWDGERSLQEAELGVVPIGYPLPEMEAVVVDDDLMEVPPGETGELVMSGPQRTPGYWQDDDATARGHVRLPGRHDRFYRTGDRVRRPCGNAPLTFMGRNDQQVKIRGHRVELGEVESSLLQCPGVDAAAAVGWPSTDGAGVLGIAAFVTGRELRAPEIRMRLKDSLQECAIPRTIRVLPDLPLNANGKVDRQALVAMLQA